MFNIDSKKSQVNIEIKCEKKFYIYQINMEITRREKFCIIAKLHIYFGSQINVFISDLCHSSFIYYIDPKIDSKISMDVLLCGHPFVCLYAPLNKPIQKETNSWNVNRNAEVEWKTLYTPCSPQKIFYCHHHKITLEETYCCVRHLLIVKDLKTIRANDKNMWSMFE